MGRIILAIGGDRKAARQYSARASLESPGLPFWLDLVSPSEHALNRLASRFKFDARALRACVSSQRSTGCDDFHNYIFTKACLLEPSKRNLFVQSDLNIFLNSRYLVTLHNRKSPILRSLASVQESGFDRPGTLLLAIFNEFHLRLMNSLCFERSGKSLLGAMAQRNKSPLWWQLRNFETALVSQFALFHQIAWVGARFFTPDDRAAFGALRAKLYFLSDTARRLLSRVDTGTNEVRRTSTGKPRQHRERAEDFARVE
jgi:CorA-like Mg2+ transporter protein